MTLFRDDFGELRDRLRGQNVGLAVNAFGNVGDRLIELGTLRFLADNDIPCHVIDVVDVARKRVPRDVTMLLEPGGGNLGTRSGLSSPKRRRLLCSSPLPKLVLPQTASDTGEDLRAFDVVFARDETTWAILRTVHPVVCLAPDMALCLTFPESTPTLEEGLFLRRDIEKTTLGGTDPALQVRTGDEYLAFAGKHRHVITNRLHFAIASLLQGQSATLLPNSYHKNHSVFKTWLHRFPKARWEPTWN